MRPLIVKECPFAERPKPDRGMTWLRPELVCQVKFANWTQDGRLRAPVFLGLRTTWPRARWPGKPARPKSPAPGREKAALEIDGHSLKFTNLGKVFYPDEGYTKRDVLNDYDAVASLILPHLKDRPLSLKRYPDGIGKEFFFQKNVAETFASWVRTEPIASEHNGRPIRYAFAQDRASLLYLVNLGCIDQNPG